MHRYKPAVLFSLFFLFASFGVFSESFIKVSANVSSASVYIDGTYRGYAPVRVQVSPGNHSVRVEKSGYDTYSGSVYVADGYEQSVSITLAASTGTLVVKAVIGSRTMRGASVYLDGLYKGTTPLTIRDVKPGLHYVRVSKTGYDDISDSVSIVAGYEKTLTATFVGADLTVYANVSGASVYVDSEYEGTTPITVRDLEVGSHTVKVIKKHYSQYSVSKNLEAGYAYTVNADLEKISGYLNTTVLPSDATLYCDGEVISKYNEEIDEGTYTIKAHAFGYDDKTATVTIARNKTSSLSITMEKADFEIKSFKADTAEINPKNSKRLNSVRFSMSVTAPEQGTLEISDVKGEVVASWDVTFTTWDSSITWDGKKNGIPVAEGQYVATLKVSGFMRIASVTVDYSIKNYEQRARSKGFFFDIGNLNGPFYDGFTVGMSGFYGKKHFYGGIAADFFMTKMTGDYENDVIKGIYFIDGEILGGASFNWHLLRPYTHVGLGYYYCMTDAKSDYKKVDGVSGLSMSWTAGADIVFDHFVIGGYYKLRKLSGSGYTDTFGVSFGWAFDK
ncbi:MAG: PEGA domain-containing protein [Treponema sp.]|uniref:PEGA domain-containing protein n=1 Tax=Treponema sp. TaxID=166 RepID=UPI0025DA49A4|nr:PEGA domain-containing protein [Treponema sp.]MBQ9281404.1 PEGA domain-containing protein [Treponema sp.]